MAALYYHHSTRKPLTNSLSVRAAGLLTGYSRDAEDQASGSAELDYPSPAEVSGSPGHAWSFEIDTSKLHGVKTCDGACCNAEKFVKLIALQLNMPSKWDARVSNPFSDEDHAKYQAALDRAENPLSPTERE